MSKKNTEVKDQKKYKNNISIKDKISNVFSKNTDSPGVKKYKKKRVKKSRKQRMVNGRFTLDILDLLIIIVVTVTISCLATGFILNYQYRKNIAYLNSNNVVSEHIREFIDVYTEIVDNFYEEVDQKGMIEAALEGMLGYLEDNYSIYLNEDETDELSKTLDGSYQGIGIVASGNIVYNVYKNSPAEVAGLKIGDEIIDINGNKVDMSNYEKITEFLKKDKENKIVVKRYKKEYTFTMVLGKVNVPSTSENVIESKGKRIGYISLTTFSANSAEDFQNSLLALNKDGEIDSLIIDLRGNTGGYLNSASNIAGIFLEKGKVIYSLDSKDGITTYRDETKQSMDCEVIVLVNQVSASASEVLAAALKDSYGATIVGKTTYGKGTVQSTKKYGNTMIKYTSAKWLRPNGECVNEIGINPDYEIEVEIKNSVLYDKQLDKAIELLS